ncbi:hypothetical protein [Ligilactobacillus salivarius]|uniref:hypothetical protein n=1 Tax=Ligilactobacillus salivarius TaxID=1624 RepID=UPI00364B34F2
MEDKVRLILDKLDSANVTGINYDYYFKGSEMVEDSFDYCDEFDTLYELLIVSMYNKHNIDPYNDHNSFNTFKKIDGKWFAEWLNPMGLELEISDLVNDNVSDEIIALLQE